MNNPHALHGDQSVELGGEKTLKTKSGIARFETPKSSNFSPQGIKCTLNDCTYLTLYFLNFTFVQSNSTRQLEGELKSSRRIYSHRFARGTSGS